MRVRVFSGRFRVRQLLKALSYCLGWSLLILVHARPVSAVTSYFTNITQVSLLQGSRSNKYQLVLTATAKSLMANGPSGAHGLLNYSNYTVSLTSGDMDATSAATCLKAAKFLSMGVSGQLAVISGPSFITIQALPVTVNMPTYNLVATSSSGTSVTLTGSVIGCGWKANGY